LIDIVNTEQYIVVYTIQATDYNCLFRNTGNRVYLTWSLFCSLRLLLITSTTQFLIFWKIMALNYST